MCDEEQARRIGVMDVVGQVSVFWLFEASNESSPDFSVRIPFTY